MANGTMELLRSLKIDPEFRDKIPPLTDAEFQQLRENILDAGEVYEPIRVWNGVVIDGHNRLKVVQENPNIKWQTRDMEFADKWAAFDWMYRNQLGRRNLTDEQRTYMIGKMYEARKKHVGNTTTPRNADGTFQLGQNGPNGKDGRQTKDGTAGEIANDLKVGTNTVKRAEKFARGIDVLKQLSPEAADKVLKGQAKVKSKSMLGNDIDVKVNKRAVAALAGVGPEIQQQVAKAIEKGEALPAMTPTTPKPMKRENGPELPTPTTTTADSCLDRLLKTHESAKSYAGDTKTRELYRTLDKAYAPMLDLDAKSTYNLDDLYREVKEAGEMFVNSFCGTLDDRKYLLDNDAAWDVVNAAIADVVKDIQDGITRMKGGMKK